METLEPLQPLPRPSCFCIFPPGERSHGGGVPPSNPLLIPLPVDAPNGKHPAGSSIRLVSRIILKARVNSWKPSSEVCRENFVSISGYRFRFQKQTLTIYEISSQLFKFISASQRRIRLRSFPLTADLYSLLELLYNETPACSQGTITHSCKKLTYSIGENTRLSIWQMCNRGFDFHSVKAKSTRFFTSPKPNRSL